MDPAVPSGYCTSCDYPLAGVPGTVCPECGRAFDPADPKTFAAKPGARRRRWTRRALYALGVLVLIELFAPSRVAKFTWSWPNQDGVTATSETKWCLIAPRWMPIRYPRWTSARSTKQIEPQGLATSEEYYWAIGLFSISSQGWCISGPVPPRANWLTFGSLGTKTSGGEYKFLDMAPPNLDRLCDILMDNEHSRNRLDYSLHVVPQTPSAPTVSPTKDK